MAGWYPDPDASAETKRYWNGDDRTEETPAANRVDPAPVQRPLASPPHPMPQQGHQQHYPPQQQQDGPQARKDPGRPARRQPPTWLWSTLVVWLASRATVAAAIEIAAVLKPRGLSYYWGRWDTVYYLEIARHGYPVDIYQPLPGQTANAIAFFPGYPLLVRAVAPLFGGHLLIAGVTINVLLSILLFCLIRVLFAHLGGPVVADRGVLIFAFFWGTSVFTLSYAEPLALIAAAACLLALFRQRWLLAGLAAAVGTSARPPLLVALVLTCTVAAGLEVRRNRNWSALVAPLLAPVGALAYFSYLGVHTGDFFAWQHNEAKLWDTHVDGGLPLIRFVVNSLLHPTFKYSPYYGLILVTAIMLIPAVVLLVRARPPLVVLIFVGSILGPLLLTSASGTTPRYVSVAFPLAYGVAKGLKRRTVHLVVASSALLLFAATGFYMTGSSGGF